MTRREALQRAAALSGWALTPSLLAALESCQTTPEVNWEPQFLSREQAAVIGQLVNRILPPTQTLGALDVGVDRFIDHMLLLLFTEEERQSFVQQLDEFSLQNADFVSSEEKIQNEKLYLLEQTHAKAGPDAPKSFYRTLKELALLGYFTSEAVMTQQLNYHAVPARYEGCIPLSEPPRLYVDNNV